MTLILLGSYGLVAAPVTTSSSNGKQKHRTPQELFVNSNQKWTGIEIAMVTLMAIYLVFWITMITSAFTSTKNRPTAEQLFSVFEALLLPEIWLFQHGINASQEGSSFFEALPAK